MPYPLPGMYGHQQQPGGRYVHYTGTAQRAGTAPPPRPPRPPRPPLPTPRDNRQSPFKFLVEIRHETGERIFLQSFGHETMVKPGQRIAVGTMIAAMASDDYQEVMQNLHYQLEEHFDSLAMRIVDPPPINRPYFDILEIDHLSVLWAGKHNVSGTLVTRQNWAKLRNTLDSRNNSDDILWLNIKIDSDKVDVLAYCPETDPQGVEKPFPPENLEAGPSRPPKNSPAFDEQVPQETTVETMVNEKLRVDD